MAGHPTRRIDQFGIVITLWQIYRRRLYGRLGLGVRLRTWAIETAEPGCARVLRGFVVRRGASRCVRRRDVSFAGDRGNSSRRDVGCARAGRDGRHPRGMGT